MRKSLFALLATVLIAKAAFAASVDGIPIHSTVIGEGPTIVFVHGWTCDVESWREQVPAFSSTHQVIALDLPGHGQSGRLDASAFSMELFARAVESVREESGGEKIVLVGHSMGVVVIRKYALMYPDHVAGLVAVDGPLDMEAFVAQFGEQEVNMTHEMREQFVRSMFTEDTPASLQNDILDMMLRPPTATANGAASAMIDLEMIRPKVIDAPTLVIVAGTADAPEQSFLDTIHSDIRAIQMDGTGHFLMMEKPAEFNGLLQDFLASADFK